VNRKSVRKIRGPEGIISAIRQPYEWLELRLFCDGVKLRDIVCVNGGDKLCQMAA
jgi:hypothetical protein